MALDPAFEISESERELLELYARLHALLAEHGEELPPFARRNAVKALAALWQVANGVGAQPGQVYDVGA
jgi:hypothetical protein